MNKVTRLLKRDNGKHWPDIAKEALAVAWQWGGDVVIQIKEDKADRTTKQNSLLFLWHSEFAAHLLEHNGGVFDSEEIHEFIVGKLLPKRAITMPDGEPAIVRTSTKKLKVKEFADFLTKYEMLCADSYGLMLSRPDELYLSATMRERMDESEREGM